MFPTMLLFIHGIDLVWVDLVAMDGQVAQAPALL